MNRRQKLKSILDKHAKWLACEPGGVRACLSRSDLRDADLSNADLRDADLSNADLSYADLGGCDLRSVNLSDCDLSYARLRGADLSNADLSYARLRGADLRGVTGIPSDPALLRLVCQEALKPEQLNMDSWHTCETAHCLAGWAIHLSGHAGQVMERLLGPETAGALLIPDASHMFNAPDVSVWVWCEKWLEEHPEELTSDGAG